MSDELGSEVLPCGRDPLDVVDRARVGRSTGHEKGCPYCRAVIADDAPTLLAVSELAGAEADIAVPDTLLPSVMGSVWSQLRRDALIPLPTDAGSAFVADHAIAAVIENALDEGADLQVYTCRVTLDRQTVAADPPTSNGPRIDIAVTMAAAYRSDVHDTAAQARGTVSDVIATQFGWAVDAIDIDIVDVYLRPGTST